MEIYLILFYFLPPLLHQIQNSTPIILHFTSFPQLQKQSYLQKNDAEYCLTIQHKIVFL